MSKANLPVILVDDEKQILLSYKVMLRSEGIENVVTIDDSRKVMSVLGSMNGAVVVLDLNMPHISGIELLDKISHEFENVPVIIVTAINDLENAVECMKQGAIDYLVKPIENQRLISSIKKTLELRGLRDEVSSLRHHITSLRRHLLTDKLEHQAAFASYLTNSKKMKAIFLYVESVAESSEPVLIAGETGVGKEMIAKAIHEISKVKGEFVAVNVAGLDDNMFSDTLFGHKKGAFTGADRDREGLIVRANGGTLLLDEIGDLSESSQVKLLRLLEEGVYYSLGSDSAQTSHARIITSTNRNLTKEISDRKFRKDLYYRLAAIQVQIPPLRERVEDIPILLNHFLEESALSLKKTVPSIPAELLTLLSTYYFSGNVRELKAMVFDAVAQHKSGVMSLNRFKDFIKKNGDHVKTAFADPEKAAGSVVDLSGPFPSIKEVTEYLVYEAMKRSGGNQGIAASLLGISRHALNKRLNRKV